MTAIASDEAVEQHTRLEIKNTRGALRITLHAGASPVTESVYGEIPWAQFDRYYQSINRMLIGSEPTRSDVQNHIALQREVTKLVTRVALPGDLAGRLHDLRLDSRSRSIILLSIETDDPRLDCVPWELLGADKEDRLADLAVWRSIKTTDFIAVWPTGSLLLVQASPLDIPVSPNADQEFRSVQEQLEKHRRTDDVRCAMVDHAQLDDMVRKIEEFRPTVLHLAMQGDDGTLKFELHQKQEEGRGARADQRKRAVRRHRAVKHSDLVSYFGVRREISAIVMTVCRTALARAHRSCFARRLVENGVPAAIGMTRAITPEASTVFANSLYNALFSGQALANAYAAAISAVRSSSIVGNCLWSVPVLYMNRMKVVPFPTNEYIESLRRISSAISRLDRLREGLQRLAADPGMTPAEWDNASTGVQVGLQRTRTALQDLWAVSDDTELLATSYRVNLREVLARVGNNLQLVQASVWALRLENGSTEARFRAAQDFTTSSGELEEALKLLRDIVANQFAVISDST
jgi:CHAT domain